MACSAGSQTQFQDFFNSFPDKDDLIKEVKTSEVLGLAFLGLLDRCISKAFEARYEVCLADCDILLDMTWEKLNTGYWKDVHLDWRRVYTVISVVKVFCQCHLLKNKLTSNDSEIKQTEDSSLADKNVSNQAADGSVSGPSAAPPDNVTSSSDDSVSGPSAAQPDNVTSSSDDSVSGPSAAQPDNVTSSSDDSVSGPSAAQPDNVTSSSDDSKNVVTEENKAATPDKVKESFIKDTNSLKSDALEGYEILDSDLSNTVSKTDDERKVFAADAMSGADEKSKTGLTDEMQKIILKNISLADVLKSCDMGLLMGAPLLDNILAKLSTKIHLVFGNPRKRNMAAINNVDESCNKKLKNYLEGDVGSEHDTKSGLDTNEISESVERVSCPSLESFRKNYVETNTPVIITNAIDFWPAFRDRRWTVDYIKDVAGYRTVPIELGSKYTEDTWSQDLMTVKDFIEKFIENKNPPTTGYLAQHQLFDQVPELQNDIVIPTYCCLGNGDDVETNAWFGPKNTVSPLHFDAKQNLLAQVLGEKRIKLYSNEYADSLYPHPDRLLFNTSQVDAETPDLEKFPRFADVPCKECVLRAGELLYIPAECWHFVRSLSVSFSVSFWWE